MPAASTKALCDAINFRDDEKVLKLLKAGADPNKCPRDGNYPLVTATWYCQADYVKLLLEHGAEVDIDDGAPLLNAVLTTNGQAQPVLELLLARGAQLNRLQSSNLTETKGSLLMVAIANGRPDLAHFLIAKGIDLTLKNDEDDTAFYWAGAMDFLKVGRAMLQAGYRPRLDNEYEARFAELLAKTTEFHDNHLETLYTLEPMRSGNSPHSTGNPDLKTVYAGDHFPGCANPPVHLLTLDLREIPELPQEVRAVGPIHVVYQNCDDCDGEDFVSFQLGADGRLEDIVYEDEEDSESDEDEAPTCDPDSYHNSKRRTLLRARRLKPGEYADTGFLLGGLPHWLQTNQWGDCVHCGDTAFYIGSIYQFKVPPTAEGAGNYIYTFVCPRCRTVNLVRQMT